MDSCQWACQKNPMCNFFTFSKDKNVCMLHRVDIRKRVCDMIHGPPVPSLQSCLDDMEIPWALSSGEFSKIRNRLILWTFYESKPYSTNISILFDLFLLIPLQQ